jgi:hypothetical protein
MLSAACLGLRGSVLFLPWGHQQRRLTGREPAAASALGAAITAAIGALLLHGAQVRPRCVAESSSEQVLGSTRPGEGSG